MSTTRPTVRGFGGAVAAGHPLAAQIGAAQLAAGGNAADAACAMGFALWVLEPTQNGPGGEVPILVREAAADRVVAISGQGPAPAAATIARMRGAGLALLPPDGLLSAAIPAALDAWCRLLEVFGTRRLAEVVAPARGLAESGFPMYPFLRGLLEWVVPRFEREWPTSAEIYAPVRADGARQTNPPLAAWLASLCDAERAAGGSREAGIRAARDSFYRGAGAEAIARFLETPVRDASGEAHAGLLTADDLARYQGALEEPCCADYRGATVYKCGPWSQGPVFLQQLRLLEGTGIEALDPGGADALHLWLETAKLAFADREACYGDPRFAEVPLATLLSRDYAEARRSLVDPERASHALRPGLGRLPEGWPLVGEGEPPMPVEPGALAAAVGRTDTTQCVAADAHGNVVSATPSGGWIPTSPVVPGLGFPVGTRLQMACLDPSHPNALAPGKRPRTTLSPSLARLADGRWLGFGTPGGDQQDQWTSQLFLRLAHGDADLQAAIDAPTVHSEHAPSSFYPRRARPGVAAAESRLGEAVLRALEQRGHAIERRGAWENGRVMAAAFAPDGGPQEAAASPRFAVAYAIALP